MSKRKKGKNRKGVSFDKFCGDAFDAFSEGFADFTDKIVKKGSKYPSKLERKWRKY